MNHDIAKIDNYSVYRGLGNNKGLGPALTVGQLEVFFSSDYL